MNTPNRNDLHPQSGDALLIVDVQNDFLPGGSLAVPRGGEVVAVLNRYLKIFTALPVYAEALQLPSSTVIVSKATTVEQDAYSGFEGTNLDQQLRAACMSLAITAWRSPQRCSASRNRLTGIHPTITGGGNHE